MWYLTNGGVGTKNCAIIRDLETERGVRARVARLVPADVLRGDVRVYRIADTLALYRLPYSAKPTFTIRRS